MASRNSPSKRLHKKQRYRRYRKSACETCGATADLSVHHADGNARNDEPRNLVTLCVPCHQAADGNVPRRLPRMMRYAIGEAWPMEVTR